MAEKKKKPTKSKKQNDLKMSDVIENINLTPGKEIERFESDRNVLQRDTLYLDGRNIQTGRTTGTKIGTATDQKIAFYGTTPVTQRLKANYNNWASLSDVVDALVDLGLFDQA